MPPMHPWRTSWQDRRTHLGSVIGTVRREYLDWLIPLTESHLRTVLQSWVRHYNTGRPHMALGPGVPDPPPVMPREAASTSHPHLRKDWIVRARSILGGLRLVKKKTAA